MSGGQEHDMASRGQERITYDMAIGVRSETWRWGLGVRHGEECITYDMAIGVRSETWGAGGSGVHNLCKDRGQAVRNLRRYMRRLECVTYDVTRGVRRA